MTCIGLFTATPEGFEGHIRTLSIDSRITLNPAEPTGGENAPHYRVMAGEADTAFEVGAGWKRTGEKAGDYIAVLLDDPAFPRPLRANLFAAGDGAHTLVWSRRSRRTAKD